MSDDELTYKGGDRDALIDVVARAVAILTQKNPDKVKPNENGDLLIWGDSVGLLVLVEDDPSSMIFTSHLLKGVNESAALYALINEINADIAIGTIYYEVGSTIIRYYYKYPAENPSPELVATIIAEMLDEADIYDDRLKVRLGGKRMSEDAEDEIED